MLILQSYQMDHFSSFALRLIIIEGKIQNTYAKDRFQVKVPFTLFRLLYNRKGRIINASFLEKVVLFLLHLYDKFLPLLIFTIDIIHSSAILLSPPYLLRVSE